MALVDKEKLLMANMYGNSAPITYRGYADKLIKNAPTVDAIPAERYNDLREEAGAEID